jgi:ABC-2 type transport system permease protein
MSPFWTVFLREARQILHNPALRFAVLPGPVVGFLLVMWIFSSGVPRDLPVTVIDQDHTALSRQLTRMIDATPIASVLSGPSDPGLARQELEAGKTDAVVIIPEGTEKNIFLGKQSRIPIFINNANVLKGSLLLSGLRKVTGTISAGIKIQGRMKAGKRQEEAYSLAMPVAINPVLLFNPYTSYSYYLTAAVLPVILILFVLLGTVYAIGNELYLGTGLEWLDAAGGKIFIALIAKLLPYTLIFSVLSMLMNVLLFYYMGMPVHGSLGYILAGEILMIISYQFVAVLLLGLTANMRLSLSLGSAYCMLALTYCGLTFPAFGMPAFAQALSKAFPYTYYIKILVGQSLRGEPVWHAMIPLLALFIFILAGAAFIPRLKFLLLNEKHWGKY